MLLLESVGAIAVEGDDDAVYGWGDLAECVRWEDWRSLDIQEWELINVSTLLGTTASTRIGNVSD